MACLSWQKQYKKSKLYAEIRKTHNTDSTAQYELP